YLSDYEDFNGGFVAFRSDPKGGKITGTQDSYVAEDVAPAVHGKPFETSPKDNDVQVTDDIADKEGQHQMIEDEQVLHDELEKMIVQEV
ncbi:hypothetical protein Tco_0507012, partial [Tanacetum coccineum]